MNIYVGNLPFNATEEALRQAFEAFGKVSSARIIKDKYTGQSMGLCFVEMPERAEGEKAIKSLNASSAIDFVVRNEFKYVRGTQSSDTS